MKEYFGKKDSVAPKKITLNESSLTNFKKTMNDNQHEEVTIISKLNYKENDELVLCLKKRKIFFFKMCS